MNHNPEKFNIKQLSTWEDAIATAKKLNTIGGGVSDSHGIYIPSWISDPLFAEQPNFYDDKTGKAYFFIHYRFKNGKEGVNAGLVQDLFRRYAMAPWYVIIRLKADIE